MMRETSDSTDFCRNKGKTTEGGWSEDKYDAGGDDGESGDAMEGGTSYIDILRHCKDLGAWEGTARLIALFPVEKRPQ